MRVLLIHQSDAQKAAAALAVNVGHFDDPVDREGLAHYLEHMLFLGTEKYPKVGDFQSYISQNGGTNNAWTGTEHTCFFFDISADQFANALDRFSQFFIAPLFNEEALDKERQAVESEYRLKLLDDSRRLYQVQKEMVNPAHPFAKFSVGNLETLGDRDGQSIRDEIVAFYQQHYSADLMTLTVYGPQSLDELEQLVQQDFSSIANQGLTPKTVSVPFSDAHSVGCWVDVEPVKDLRKLILTFPMPGMEQYYQTKPLSFFAHLLGDEGPGSLMQQLKTRGWITSLSAGGGASGSNYRDFAVSCNLTELGLSHTKEIVQAVFQYIELIKAHALEAWRYDEKRAVLESAFRFQEPARPLDLVSHLVVNMQHYSPEDVIYGDYKMMHFDLPLLEQILPYFTIDNLRVTQVSKGLTTDREAKWYHTPYAVTRFSDDDRASFTAVNPSWAFHLPERNPYICYDLDPAPLLPGGELPALVEDLEGFRLWHLQEREFRVPKGVMYIAIDSPFAVASTKNIVMTRLCVEMFLDSLIEETYQAEVAGMGYNMYAHQGGVTLALFGFSQKLPQLLELILQRFAAREFKTERFESIQQQLQRAWQNAAQDRPISQLFNAMTGILQPNNPPYTALLDALESVKVAELAPFVSTILSQLHVEMFVCGDWTQQQAVDMASTLKDALRVKEQRYEEALRPLVMLGDSGSFQKEIDCHQPDSAVVIYHQCEDIAPHHIALYTLANHLMSATFFHEIRTKQQLGYMVGTGNMPLNRHPGIVMYVQSPNAAPAELVGAIDEFLNAFYMVLLELTEAQWRSSKQGLHNQIATPDTTLRGRAQRLWVAIGNKDVTFSQKEQVLLELDRLERSDMIRFVVNELKPRTANRLIMHTQGSAHQDAPRIRLGQEIGSIEEFQLRPKDCDLG
nr:insulinase family protein [Vibrio agarilyticus]